MKKGVLVFVLVFLILGGLFVRIASAAEDREDQIDAAFECLKDEVRKRPSLTLEEAIFAYLAGLRESKVLNVIDDEKDDEEYCWPDGNCDLRTTALVSIAKGQNGKNNDPIIEWLQAQTKVPTGLIWYLEITITDESSEDKSSTCTVSYDGGDYSVTINDDQTVSGSGGGCFTVANNNYWFKLSDSCVEKQFSISCGKDFRSDLIYKEQSGDTVFVSSNSGSSVGGGVHTQEISAKCFEQDGNCNYEGSIWAAAALADEGEEVSDYIPYLLGLRNTNSKYFPETLLTYVIGSSGNDLVESIMSEMNQGHWDISGSPYSAYYDTSLAMLALKSIGMGVDNTETWLFDVVGQTEEGCWNANDLADTGFVLYAMGWADKSSGSSSGGVPILPGEGNETDQNDTDDDYDPFGPNNCETAGYYCGERLGCITAGGDELTAYNCDLFTETCCSIPIPTLQSCTQMGGEICQFDEECSATEVSASDGACCLEGCVEIQSGSSSKECESDLDCPSGKVCSASGNCVDEDSGGSLWWLWVILLIILIGLVVLGIVYKDKLRVYLYKFKKGKQSGAVGSGRFPPRGPPTGFVGRRPAPNLQFPARRFSPAPRRMPPARRPMPQRRVPTNPKDKEIEDTLKKLKEMGE